MKFSTLFILGVVMTSPLLADYDQGYSAQPSVYYQEKETWGGQDMQQRDMNRPQTYPQDSRTYPQDSRNTQDFRDNRQSWGSQSDGNMNNSDQKISQKIQNILKGGFFSKSYDRVSYAVNNGNVTLNGSVDNDSDKKNINKKVQDIDGVRNVQNQIQVLQTSEKR